MRRRPSHYMCVPYDPFVSEHVSANAGKKTVHNSPDDDPDMDVIISKMPKVGRRNSDGVLVLPKEYYDPADDIYDESC